MVFPLAISVDYSHDHLFQHNKSQLVMNQYQNDDHVVVSVENERLLHRLEPIEREKGCIPQVNHTRLLPNVADM